MRLALSLSDIRSAKAPEDLTPVIFEISVRYELSHMSFLVARSGTRDTGYPLYFTTYPATWIEAYLARHFFETDPVLEAARSGHLPVDWSSLGRTVQDRHFFEEARFHGIGPNGLTIPVRGAYGELGFFSVASDLCKDDWFRLCATSTNDLHILSHYLHEAVFAITGLRKGVSPRKLSRRETQCLHLLATGKIHKQIAAALGISESSVRLYLRSAREKLFASTSHQAVAKATYLELINL
ncbi:putative transcriptional activator protein TraR [Rhizobium sp. CECT 9324]|nr:LuxR family transcriptional regulator [Rhizobium sp. CECT 9324]CAH0343215.1 putative transcriptional activator protein TraR [Rhizobium sp. CECT 9324]